LLELLIVVALILIMFVMLHGSGSRTHQQRQKLACQKNLQTIAVALQIYAGDHDGAFPFRADAQSSEEALALLVPRYTSLTQPFICPGSKDAPLPEGESFEKRTISYAYYMGRVHTNDSPIPLEEAASTALLSDRQVNSASKPKGAQVFSADGKPPGNNHHKYGGNVLFVDGSVSMISGQAPAGLELREGERLLNPRR
jgi:prepilin-type processing-associated H-X9-DG protein